MHSREHIYTIHNTHLPYVTNTHIMGIYLDQGNNHETAALVLINDKRTHPIFYSFTFFLPIKPSIYSILYTFMYMQITFLSLSHWWMRFFETFFGCLNLFRLNFCIAISRSYKNFFISNINCTEILESEIGQVPRKMVFFVYWDILSIHNGNVCLYRIWLCEGIHIEIIFFCYGLSGRKAQWKLFQAHCSTPLLHLSTRKFIGREDKLKNNWPVVSSEYIFNLYSNDNKIIRIEISEDKSNTLINRNVEQKW